MVIRIAILLLFSAAISVAETEYIRDGEPKACFLFNLGKGPAWTTNTPTEFQLNFLRRKQPYVDDTIFDPSPEALKWIDKEHDPTISEIARMNGRRVLRIVYSHSGKHRDIIDCVLLAFETADSSDWFSPFFVAHPEYFEGRFVSGKDIPFGYIATLSFSGTGGYRNHYLFTFQAPYPTLSSTIAAGRVRSIDFDSEDEYEEALKVFDAERELMRGEQGAAVNP